MPSISPSAYFEPGVLGLEVERIFSESFFVAPATRLAAPQAYRSYRLGTLPLVTRAVAGGFATFENVCLHRANLIAPPGFGAGAFRCGYHGWSYGDDGSVAKAPLAEAPPSRCLRHWPAVAHSGLVFSGVKGAAALPAHAQAALERIGFAQPAGVFHSGTLAHATNWKLMVENVLEAYHLSFVHPATFVGAGYSSASALDWAAEGPSSWNFVAAQADAAAALAKVVPGARAGYAHAYVFPNLFVSITSGLVGFISHFMPSAAGETTLEWDLFEMPLLQAQRESVRKFVREESVRFTTAALLEDKALLESSWQGIQAARAPHALQANEARVRHFHETYLEKMRGA